MKFQAAAMARADIPEDQRVDFSLYVDEFQNFATDSFESILSEARKYKLSLIMGNQFMTQLTDKIREAIIGNVGTVISGRIGITDAELMVKKFQPTFDVDDLAKLPNFQSITSVMINNVPSAPFSMNWIPPMGQVNTQLRDALVRLSSAKYGKPRSVVEKEIFDRLRDSKASKPASQQIGRRGGAPSARSGAAKAGGSSFLDEWLAKRQQLGGKPAGTPRPAYAGAAAKPISNPNVSPLPVASAPSAVNSAATTPPSSATASLPPASPFVPPSAGTSNNRPQALRNDTVMQYGDISAPAPLRQPVVNSSNTTNSQNQNISDVDFAKTPQSPPVTNRLDLRDNNSDDTEVSISLR